MFKSLSIDDQRIIQILITSAAQPGRHVRTFAFDTEIANQDNIQSLCTHLLNLKAIASLNSELTDDGERELFTAMNTHNWHSKTLPSHTGFTSMLRCYEFALFNQDCLRTLTMNSDFTLAPYTR